MGFYKINGVYRSTLFAGVKHGFSTREGGVSVLPHTASMNIAFNRGDDDGIVLNNLDIFANEVCGCGLNNANSVISVHQVHGKDIMYVTEQDCGLGTYRKTDITSDGYVTDIPNIPIMVKIADCVPILMWDGESIISAIHAGWRGTVQNIVGEAVDAMVNHGAYRKNIRVAIGPSIHKCCYEVGNDLYRTALTYLEKTICDKFITPIHEKSSCVEVADKIYEKYLCDLQGLNQALLVASGISLSNIDIAPLCTSCHPHQFFSHRASKGIRGTMGAIICL